MRRLKPIHILYGAIVLVIIAIGVLLILISIRNSNIEDQGTGADSLSSSTTSIESEITSPTGWDWSNGQCDGENGAIELTHLPMDPDDFSYLLPLGLMVGAHVTPVDHVYFSPADPNSSSDAYGVYATADGVITSVQIRRFDIGAPDKKDEEFRMTIEHTCTMYTYVDLVRILEPSLAEEVGEFGEGDASTKYLRYPVQAGDVIGYIGGQTLDFGVYDREIVLDGFIKPESYIGEPWKVHTQDILPYFISEVEEQLIAKSIRTIEPLGGKIDYDKEGYLVGNWFLEGTNGYSGVESVGTLDYWSGHLAIAYDYLDPRLIIISIGDYKGESKQFATRTNSPDPAQVTKADGLVAYDLVDYSYFIEGTKTTWDRQSLRPIEALQQPGSEFYGSVLFEVLDGNMLRMEVFAGTLADDVTEFTENARIYSR